MALPAADGRIDLPALLTELGRRGCNEVMVEAGAGLAGALLQNRLVDEIVLYQAPLLLGSGARGLFEVPLLSAMAQRTELSLHDLRQIGKDIRMILRLA